MDRMSRKQFLKPESTLIEQTALALATEFYEVGRSQGLTSKYKTHKAYARAYVKEYIPKAVELLMQILANPATPETQKAAIYDCFLERVNDKDLANTGVPVLANPFADKFVSDKVIPQSPIVGTSKKNRIEDLPLSEMLLDRGKLNS
jgi:hypothetical protein